MCILSLPSWANGRVATKIFEDFDSFWPVLPLKERFLPDNTPSAKVSYPSTQDLSPSPSIIYSLGSPPPQVMILPIETKCMLCMSMF